MKLLYYVDFDHYEKYGASVTNAKYRKLPHGPYPDKIEQIVEDMERRGLVVSVKGARGMYAQNRLVTKNGVFDPLIFSGAEMEILNSVACRWEGATAKQIENATHKEAPWAATETGKAIDYEMAQYRSPLDDNEEVDDMLAKSPEFLKFVSSLK